MLEAESCQVCRQDKELDSDIEDSGNPDISRIKSIPDHTMLKIRNGDKFRRNRRDIIQSKETSFKEPIVELDDEDEDTVRDKETSDSEVENPDTTEVEDARTSEIAQRVQPYKTHVSREVRRPKYLSEYV